MALTFVSCPYCNSTMPMPDAVPASGRIACARCGETFPTGSRAEATAEGQTTQAPAAETTPVELKRRNRKTGWLILIGMAVIAVAALLFAVYSRGQRGTRSLDESPALAYLPDDTNVIVAVNVPAADRARKTVQPGDDSDFVDRLFFAGNSLINVAQMTGLNRDQIEEIMIGLKVDSNLIPSVRIIVRTRSDYDAKTLREKLGSFRSKQEGAKQLDSIRPKGLPLEAVLWCATSNTFVMTLTPEDMQKVPDKPAKNVERLSPPLVDLMRYRSDKETFFWLIGHADNWERTTLGFFAKSSKKITAEERKKLFMLRTFAFAMRVDSGTVTSRSRPARITEQVDPAARGFAVDLVLKAQKDEDAMELRELFETWLTARPLEMRDSNLSGPLYSATVTGSPDEWQRALESIRAALLLR